MALRDWFRRRDRPAPPEGTPDAFHVVEVRAGEAGRVETVPTGNGFVRIRAAGVPAWADAFARRRPPGTSAPPDEGTGDAAFDAGVLLRARAEVRHALGRACRNALAEALDTFEAVRLGEGCAEAMVRAEHDHRDVRDRVASIARAFAGPPGPLDRIARWAREDEAPTVREACLAWLLPALGPSPRASEAARAALEDVSPAVRLVGAAALGLEGRPVLERLTRDDDPRLRARALTLLAATMPEDERLDELLIAGLADRADVVKTASLEALAARGRRAPAHRLATELFGWEEGLRRRGWEVLGGLGDDELVFEALVGSAGGERPSRERLLSLARANLAGAPARARLAEWIAVAGRAGGRRSHAALRAIAEAASGALAREARDAAASIRERLGLTEGALSIDVLDGRGRLSAAGGGELSGAPSAGGVSVVKKRP